MNLLFAISEDKIDIDTLILINDKLYNNFKESYLSQGKAYNKIDDLVYFEKELEDFLGEKFKEGIKHVVKSKNFDF